MNLLAIEGLGEVASIFFVAGMGILIVFLGMAFIVAVLLLIGKFFNRTKKETKKEEIKVQETTQEESNDLDNKTKAAIFAAIYMYYLNEGSSCEFVVKKIKKI